MMVRGHIAAWLVQLHTHNQQDKLKLTTRPRFLMGVSNITPFSSASLLISTNTHTHPFNGPLSGTTRVGRYQKGKTKLDFTEATDSEWQQHQLGHMQVSTSLQADNHASTPPLSFLQAGCPSCRPANSVKALKASHLISTGCHNPAPVQYLSTDCIMATPPSDHDGWCDCIMAPPPSDHDGWCEQLAQGSLLLLSLPRFLQAACSSPPAGCDYPAPVQYLSTDCLPVPRLSSRDADDGPSTGSSTPDHNTGNKTQMPVIATSPSVIAIPNNNNETKQQCNGICTALQHLATGKLTIHTHTPV